MYVWIALKTTDGRVCVFLCGSCTLFTRPASIDFSKFFFKTGSHGTIHIFKNYFAIVFSIFNNKRYPNKLYINFVILTLDLMPYFDVVSDYSTNYGKS